MSRTSNNQPVREIIREYLQGQRIPGRTVSFISKAEAERMASELCELLPRSSGPKAWAGYSLDRMTVLITGISKAQVKAKWIEEIHAIPDEVRTVYSGTGIYRYSFTAPDYSTHDIWIVPAGTEGFGPSE